MAVHFEFTKALYSINEFAGSFNKTFINFGLDPLKFDFDHYPFMRDFVNKSSDYFTIIVLRFNETNCKAEVLRKLKITEFFDLNKPGRFKVITDAIRR